MLGKSFVQNFRYFLAYCLIGYKFRTLGSSFGSRFMGKAGFFLNNGLNLFSFKSENETDTGNLITANKQPRALMTPLLTYNKMNPCIPRYSISYCHVNDHGDDFALTGKASSFTLMFFFLVFFRVKIFNLFKN